MAKDGEFAYEKHCQRLQKSPQRSMTLWRTQRSQMIDVLLQEMEELTSVIDRKKKREKKHLSKRRAKVL